MGSVIIDRDLSWITFYRNLFTSWKKSLLLSNAFHSKQANTTYTSTFSEINHNDFKNAGKYVTFVANFNSEKMHFKKTLLLLCSPFAFNYKVDTGLQHFKRMTIRNT